MRRPIGSRIVQNNAQIRKQKQNRDKYETNTNHSIHTGGMRGNAIVRSERQGGHVDVQHDPAKPSERKHVVIVGERRSVDCSTDSLQDQEHEAGHGGYPRAIAIVLYANPNAYSSSAKLVLVQGELGGFFGLKQPLERNVLYTNTVVSDKGEGCSTQACTPQRSVRSRVGLLPVGILKPIRMMVAWRRAMTSLGARSS